MRAIKRYFGLHASNLIDCLRRIASQPMATILTVLVIAIALALPAGLAVLVKNAETLAGSWQGAADFSVFLVAEATEDEALAFSDEILAREDVQAVGFRHRDEGLEEMREHSGFGNALDALGDENPLPHLIVVSPVTGEIGNLDALIAMLESSELTDLVQIDTDWVARLHGILDLSERIVLIANVLLGLAVVIVVGNTIRLEIQNRRTEIEVMKLVGGSDGFIRRPFLYLGLCYGGIGAIGAAVLIAITLLLLGAPVRDLASLYDSGFALAGLSLAELAILLGSGAALGWAGGGLATARHLRAIEPS